MRPCNPKRQCCDIREKNPSKSLWDSLIYWVYSWAKCWNLQQLYINVLCSLKDVAASIRENAVVSTDRQDGILMFRVDGWATITNNNCRIVNLFTSAFKQYISGIGVSYLSPAFTDSAYGVQYNDSVTLQLWDVTAGIAISGPLSLTELLTHSNLHNSGEEITVLLPNHVLGVRICLNADTGDTIDGFPFDLLIYARPEGFANPEELPSSITAFTVNGVPHVNGDFIDFDIGTTSVTIAATNNGSIQNLLGGTSLSPGENACTFDVVAEDGVTTLSVTITLFVRSLVLIYSGGTVNPSGWVGTDYFGSGLITFTYVGTNVYCSSSCQSIQTQNYEGLDGQLNVTGLPYITTVTCLGNSIAHLGALVVTGRSTITAIGLDGNPGLLHTNVVGLADCVNLISFTGTDNDFTELPISTLSVLQNIVLTSNNFNQTKIDLLISQIVAHGNSSGNLLINGAGMSTPGAGGLAGITTLISRAWFVVHN